MLIVSVILTIVPLVTIALLWSTNPPDTVDGLFTYLILLSMSGIFSLNLLLEFRRKGYRVPFLRKRGLPLASAGASTIPALQRRSPAGEGFFHGMASNGIHTERAVVRAVEFYETSVGSHDKSVVSLQTDRSGPVKLAVFLGDVRNQLLPGRKVEITYRVEPEGWALLNRDYV